MRALVLTGLWLVACGGRPAATGSLENNLFVAVGEHSTILTSTDARAWQRVDGLAVGSLSSVAFGAGSFVAVGQGGVRLLSRDGRNWRRTDGATVDQTDLHDVTHDGTRFVAVGGGFGSPPSAAWASTDGASWTKLAAPEGYMLRRVAASGPGRWVATANLHSDLMTPRLFGWNAPGETWRAAEVAVPGREYVNATFGGGRFVAVAGTHVLISSDGLTWREGGTLAFAGRRILSDAGRFIALGERGQLAHSTDAEQWSMQTSALTGSWLSALCTDGQQLVAVGGRGLVVTLASGASSWQAQTSNTSATLSAIVYARVH